MFVLLLTYWINRIAITLTKVVQRVNLVISNITRKQIIIASVAIIIGLWLYSRNTAEAKPDERSVKKYSKENCICFNQHFYPEF